MWSVSDSVECVLSSADRVGFSYVVSARARRVGGGSWELVECSRRGYRAAGDEVAFALTTCLIRQVVSKREPIGHLAISRSVKKCSDEAFFCS